MALRFRIAVVAVLAALVCAGDASAACSPDKIQSSAAEPLLSHPARTDVIGSFAMRRHPISRTFRWHRGIDYAGAIGDPVVAAAAGKVVFTGDFGEYGSAIVISHESLLVETVYAHLSRINVKVGDCVRNQQLIGAIGNSGMSSSTHLHFEVRAAVDPLGFLPRRAR